ncbi:hypothetical protein HanIR_Chr03g0139411 [Helianthus annuus]|nr:hypothetical protein HanIR_Chr03g0139411 [Helianthus annuus]
MNWLNFFQLRGNPHGNYANERQTTFSENNLKLNNQTSLTAWSLHEEGVVVVYGLICPVFNK